MVVMSVSPTVPRDRTVPERTAPAVSADLRRNFAGRAELHAYLLEQFPEVAARDDHESPIIGGRAEAMRRLEAMVPADYGATRNYLTGKVTGLSPYIRHGVVSMADVRDAVLAKVPRPGSARKLIQELGWRDYFQRLYAQLGDGVWADREPIKTGLTPDDYADAVPGDVLTATTGLVCMDAFSRQLVETGYLHNHARMWVASYLVHHRRVRWQAGAKWFLAHLLDGDPASNNLSWQWVASTFSWKPYVFNRANLQRYTESVHCDRCPLLGRCDFEGSYREVATRIFPRQTAARIDDRP